MKKLGAKLTAAVVSLVVMVCLALALASYFSSANAIKTQVETNLQSRATDVSLYIEEVYQRFFAEIEGVAIREDIRNVDMENLQPTNAALEKTLVDYPDYLAFGIVDGKGLAHYTDGSTADLSDRAYIKQALQGNTALSDIVISRVTNEPVLMLATPIDTLSGEKALLLARVDGYVLTEVVATIETGEQGYAFIVNKDGIVQAHEQKELVKEQVSLLAAEHGSAVAIDSMLTQQIGSIAFTNESQARLAGFYTLNNNWLLAVTESQDEMLAGLADLKRNLLLFACAFILLGAVIASVIAKSISKPVAAVVAISEQLGKGDFTQTINKKYLKRQDELGTLAHSLDTMSQNMRTMIHNVSDNAVLVDASAQHLQQSVRTVATGATTITTAMQDVGDSAATQAFMSEESANAMEQMAIGIQQTAETATVVATHTQQIQQQIEVGHDAVSQSMTQMTDIQHSTAQELAIIFQLEEKSQEVSDISRMISDISNQTNLLALNASIEAARAGEAGKGFAVVADEVRKLSEETATSATRIHTLIHNMQQYTQQVVTAAEQSNTQVEIGIQSIHTLEVNFTEIITAVTRIANELDVLSGSTQQMSANTEEVTASIEEMSASASSTSTQVRHVEQTTLQQQQEIEEMSAQAHSLAQMAQQLQQAVQRFTL